LDNTEKEDITRFYAIERTLNVHQMQTDEAKKIKNKILNIVNKFINRKRKIKNEN
jgi:hypothetical protein